MAGILKRYGSEDSAFYISVLVVAADGICDTLAERLYNCSTKQDAYKLYVHISHNVQDVLKSAVNPHIDFVVFAIDTRNRNSIEEVESGIRMLDNSFTVGSMCFVHSNDVKPVEMGVTYNDLWALRNKYGVHMLIGSLKDETKCLYLAQRILKLVSATVGVQLGVPYLDCQLSKNKEL